MSKSRRMSESRRQRRLYEKILKNGNLQMYEEYKRESLQRGIEIHKENVELFEKNLTEQYEKRQQKLIEFLKAQGLTPDEIDNRVAIWLETIKVWGSKEPRVKYYDLIKNQ